MGRRAQRSRRSRRRASAASSKPSVEVASRESDRPAVYPSRRLPFKVVAWRVRFATRLICVCALIGGACSSPPPEPTPSPVAARPLASPSAVPGTSVPTTDPAIHVFLWGNPATTARDLQLARDAGFRWVKQRFEWRNIEGQAKGAFQWNEPDRVVDAISQSGLKVVARVDNQPQWASSTIQWPGSGPPDNLSDWTDYLTA